MRYPILHRIALITLLLVAIIALGLGPGNAFIRQFSGASGAEAVVLAQSSTPGRPQAADTTDLPPSLLNTAPQNNAIWDGGPVVFRFDQPLNAESAPVALTVDPALPGSVTVAEGDLTFTPESAPQPGTRYTFRLSPDLASASNVSLASPVEITLQTAVPLQVTSIQPQDGALEVDTSSQIVVTFNRPVVPLTGVDDQAGLPSPLTLDPPVEGQGRWLNTSVYVFQPETALAGATEYTVTIADITGLSGESLAEPVSVRFTTAAPIVVDATPAGGQVRPDASVRVEFSQPMDPESTVAAFSLRKTGGDPSAYVDGETGWLNANRTLVFTPTTPLEFGERYLLTVAASAQPASRQGTLREDFTRSFAVVPLPAVQTVSPVQGATEVTPDASVIVRFNAPVSPTLVLENIQVTPLLTTTQVFSYYSEYLSELQLSWFKEPRTTYTVTLGAAIGDEFGNTLGEDYVLTFTTGDYPPFARLETERFTHFSAYSGTRASLLYRNVDEIDVDFYRLPETELWQLTGSNQWQTWENYQIPNAADNLIWSRTYEGDGETNVTVRQVITLTDEVGDVLTPGLYFLQVQQPAGTTPEGGMLNRSQSLVVVSNNNLTFKWSQQDTSLAWLTDLQTGVPVADQPLRFYSEGQLVGETATDAQGIATLNLDIDPDRRWMPVVAMAGEPGDADFALVSSDWSSGIAVWDFGIIGGWTLDPLQSFFYTERPIYRPGQTAYWRGIVRLLQDDQYVLPPEGMALHMSLRDPMGNVIMEEDRTLGPNGTVSGQIELANEALTGSYYMEIQMEWTPGQIIYSGFSIQVAAYRTPEFEITVSPSQPEYHQGDTVQIAVQANYFSGGPLVNAPLTWRLISDPYTFYWQDAPDNRFYSFTPFDPDQAEYDPYRGSFNLGLIREGSGQTGPDGSFTIELPADLAGAVQSQNWTFDVTVQSPTNQFVSARTSTPIHKANFYVGLSPRAYVSPVNSEVNVDLVAVTPDGDLVPDAELEIVAYEFQWNSVYARGADGVFRWETSVNRSPVYTTTATTDETGQALFAWTPDTAGQYQIVALAADEDGNATSSSVFLWVSAADPDDFVAWPRENNDRIELVADKTLYEPGDTAHVLVPSPFAGPVQALLTIERGGVVSAEVITLTGNSETLEIPIGEEHIPNIFVGIVIAKGIDETNPIPAMRIGYAQLNVDTSAKTLDIDIASSAQTVEPGASVAYTLTVTDLAGDPVADAEVSVAIVDRAILALAMGSDLRPLVDVFYYQRPLGISTSALLTINRDRMSQQLSEGAKGGGGGGGDGLELRSEFPDIAFWRADLLSDADGLITFTVDLPDNLTTWRLSAIGVTADTLVGNSAFDVVATKELQVRPLVPRFFTAGDQAQIGAAIVNTLDTGLGDGLLTLEVEGAALEGDPSPVAFELDAVGQTRQTWPITVDPVASQVVITLTATATPLSGPQDEPEPIADAVRLTIPVVRYESPETVASAGAVPPEGTLEVIHLPASAGDTGALDIGVEPSLAGGLVGGLQFLEQFPYECTEQIVSRFLPNLFSARALQTLGVESPALGADLDEQVNLGIQRLITRQNQDGGWGYWPTERSSVFITAYVLWGLASADELGYTVPARAINNAVDYLDRSFLAPRDLLYSWQLNEMAFMHFVLAEIDRGDPGRASTLYDVRERLGHYGKAYLAMALAEMSDAGAADARVVTLVEDLVGAVELTATGAWWQEPEIDFRTLNTDVRTTSIVLNALVRLDPDNPLLPQVVRWIMSARQGGHWSTTQENAWAIIALTDWLAASGELEAGYDWTVTLNGSELASGSVTDETVAERVELQVAVADLLRDEANTVRFERSSDPGSMYYTTRLRYYLDAATVEPRDRGIVIDRRFFLADGEGMTAVDTAAVGDVISVTVTIVAPTDLHQLLVEVPIPAGTEPIDPSLRTTSDQFGYPMMTLEEETGDQPSWWRYWVPTYTDLRDDKVALFATFLSAGTYEYTFNVQATLPGTFNVLPAYAEQMYFNEVWGRSAGGQFSVTE